MGSNLLVSVFLFLVSCPYQYTIIQLQKKIVKCDFACVPMFRQVVASFSIKFRKDMVVSSYHANIT
jgi:hypothetical protein